MIARHPVLTLGLAILLGGAPASAQRAAVDSTGSENDPSLVRGTVGPIPRHANPLQQTARIALVPPYAVVYAVTLPLRGVAAVHDRGHLFQRLRRWMKYRYEFDRIRLQTFFGYESELGFAVAGFDLTQENWRGDGGEWKLLGGYLNRNKNALALRLKSPLATWQGWVGAYYGNDDDRPFYGLGPGSANRRLGANQRRVGAEASLTYRPQAVAQATLTGYFRNLRLSDPSDVDPVDEVFPELFAAASSSIYGGLEGSVALDGRDAEAYSTRGALLRAWAGLDRAHGSGNDDYVHFGVEGQLFVNLYHHTRILALRGFLEGVGAGDDDTIPYVELEHLGGRLGNRGYRSFRFTDRAQLLWTAEYRYRVTHFIQAGLFVDWGTVGGDVGRLRLADLEPSYGLEINAGRRRPLTLQLAHSAEGFQLYLGRIALFDLPSRRLR